jgi:hypothetical protein
MVELNIWNAFQALRFEFKTGNEPYQLLVNEETLKETAGFRELRLIDFLWICCQLGGLPLDSVGSIRQSKTI